MTSYNNIQVALEAWGACMCLIYCICIFLGRKKEPKSTGKLIGVVAFCGFLLVADVQATYFRGVMTVYAYLVVRLFNFLTFFNSYVLSFLVLEYLIDLVKESNVSYSRFWRVSNYLLTGVAVLLLIISQFTGLYYTFDNNNNYVRSEHFFICSITVALQAILLLVCAIRFFKNLDRSKAIGILSFVILPGIAMVIQLFIYGYSIANMAILVSVNFIFIEWLYRKLKRTDDVQKENRLKEEQALYNLNLRTAQDDESRSQDSASLYLGETITHKKMDSVAEHDSDASGTEYRTEMTTSVVGRDGGGAHTSSNQDIEGDIVTCYEDVRDLGIDVEHYNHIRSMKHIFIYNPIAGNQMSLIDLSEQLARFKDIEYFVFTVDGPGGETGLVSRLQHYFNEDQIRFYCVGGSGTVRHVVNGITDLSRVEIAHIPTGATNDFLKNIDIEQEEFNDLRKMVYGRAQKVDYIETNHGRAVNTLSFGLDYLYCKRIYDYRFYKVFGKYVPGGLALGNALFFSKNQEYEFSIDNEEYKMYMSQFILGNGGIFGGNLLFDREADVFDGKGSAVISRHLTPFNIYAALKAVVDVDKHAFDKYGFVKSANHIRVRRSNGRKMAINMDGEITDEFYDWDIRIVKQGLNYVFPKGVELNEK